MSTILDANPVHAAIIICIAGVLLHNLRVYKAGKGINWKRKTEASLTMFVGSVYVVHQILATPANLALDPTAQLTLVLAQIGSIAGFGVLGQRVFDKARNKITNQQRRPDPVTLVVSQKGWYKTNFREDEAKGNVIGYGQAYLYIKVPTARSYVSGILRDANNNALQIEQSNPGNNAIRFEMFDKTGAALPRGRYTIQIQSDAGSGDGQGVTDAFEIV